MKRIPTTREQVLAAWEITKAATKRRADAQANYAIKQAATPDIQKLQAEMAVFRLEKQRREVEFAAAQLAAKAFSDAQTELHRAEKALNAAKKIQDRAEKNLVL